jgi:hypothetical protein
VKVRQSTNTPNIMSLSLKCFCSKLVGSNVSRVTNKIDVRKPRAIAVIAHRCYTTELTEKERLRVTIIPEPTDADGTKVQTRQTTLLLAV